MTNKVKVRGGRKPSLSGVDKLNLARNNKVEVENIDQSEPKMIETGSKLCLNDDLAISTITPDPTNSRDFPVLSPNAVNAFLKGKDVDKTAYVILDKGLLVNKTPSNHILYSHIENQIQDIIALAEQIKEGGGLYQPIEVYRNGGMDYRIVYGHRRFYSVVYCLGWDGVWSFRVHRATPKSPKLRQFVENNGRSALAFHEKLRAFKAAYDEAILKSPEAMTNVQEMKLLGVKKTSYYKLKKLASSPKLVNSIEHGIGFLTEIKINKLYQIAEQSIKDSKYNDFESAMIPLIVAAFNEAGKELPPSIKDFDVLEIQAELSNKVKTAMSPVKYKTPAITSPKTVKDLLTKDVTKLEIDGVNWGDVDWDDTKEVNSCLKKTIKYLESLVD